MHAGGVAAGPTCHPVSAKRGGRVIAGIAALLALLFALPNLMTLSVVLGGNSAAHAGEGSRTWRHPDSEVCP